MTWGVIMKYGWGGLEDFQGGRLFFRKLQRGAAQFFARTVGGPPIFSQENLKIELRQIISSNSYLKNFSGPPIMFLVFHVCSHFRRHLFILSTLFVMTTLVNG